MRENAGHASTGSGPDPMKRRPRSPARKVSAPAAGQVRVIGGRWRGTRLPVPAVEGLRPTPDRVRETLFNWLAPVIPGARVLDLFAGSGALGLEALSRGAAAATLVERDPGAVAGLRALVQRLQGGEAVGVVQADAIQWLRGSASAAFDIAFVDPPFASGLLQPALDGVLPLVAPDGWLYVEGPPEASLDLPAGWHLHREGRTRETRFLLYRRDAGGGMPGAPVATLPEGPEATPAADTET